jgi:hypothetical protein
MNQAIGMHSTEAFGSFRPARRKEKIEHRSVSSLKIFIFFIHFVYPLRPFSQSESDIQARSAPVPQREEEGSGTLVSCTQQREEALQGLQGNHTVTRRTARGCVELLNVTLNSEIGKVSFVSDIIIVSDIIRARSGVTSASIWYSAVGFRFLMYFHASFRLGQPS